MIGILNYLVNCTHPERSCAVHLYARLCNDPKLCHKQAVKIITRYLIRKKHNKDQGVIFNPDKSKSIEGFVDASFVGGSRMVQ